VLERGPYHFRMAGRGRSAGAGAGDGWIIGNDASAAGAPNNVHPDERESDVLRAALGPFRGGLGIRRNGRWHSDVIAGVGKSGSINPRGFDFDGERIGIGERDTMRGGKAGDLSKVGSGGGKLAGAATGWRYEAVCDAAAEISVHVVDGDSEINEGVRLRHQDAVGVRLALLDFDYVAERIDEDWDAACVEPLENGGFNDCSCANLNLIRRWRDARDRCGPEVAEDRTQTHHGLSSFVDEGGLAVFDRDALHFHRDAGGAEDQRFAGCRDGRGFHFE